MSCNVCQNPTLCTERCQAYAEQLKACAASGQMTPEQVSAHVEAGEMPSETCKVCRGYALLRSGDPCFGCGGTGTTVRRAAAPKGKTGEMEAAKGDERADR